jgi:hypothetical protein
MLSEIFSFVQHSPILLAMAGTDTKTDEMISMASSISPLCQDGNYSDGIEKHKNQGKKQRRISSLEKKLSAALISEDD